MLNARWILGKVRALLFGAKGEFKGLKNTDQFHRPHYKILAKALASRKVMEKFDREYIFWDFSDYMG